MSLPINLWRPGSGFILPRPYFQRRLTLNPASPEDCTTGVMAPRQNHQQSSYQGIFFVLADNNVRTPLAAAVWRSRSCLLIAEEYLRAVGIWACSVYESVAKRHRRL